MRNRLGQAFLNFMEWRRQRRQQRKDTISDQICPHCWTKLIITVAGDCQQCGVKYNPAHYGDSRMR